MDQNTKEEGKTMAIISYITVIGLIIAYFMNKDKNNEFVKFHIGQSLRVFILAIVISIVVNILVSVTGIGLLSFLSYIPLILIILGIINAVNLKAEPLPVIGTIGGK
ncbi:DUF4870 domain-containing protein [Costertonia aggregata]|uniref:DUF4870 domain-containing protein n=1 Tax=Costertonia aggregata TaxID=343403 RepID=A0A7H9AUJ0_9FLAO|nr:DUF4870 domain-containing protein [Costertonia aggregata]QLG47110.1 DUF4870 domain-containing protein [Costertonia aggregata]